jgi:hypothetical protein
MLLMELAFLLVGVCVETDRENAWVVLVVKLLCFVGADGESVVGFAHDGAYPTFTSSVGEPFGEGQVWFVADALVEQLVAGGASFG